MRLYSTETRKEEEQADHVYAPRLWFVTECRHDQRRLSQLAHPLTIRRLSMSMTLAPLIILTNFINKIRKDTSPLCSHSSKDAHEHFLESLITPQLEHDMKRVRSSDIPKTTQKISIADISKSRQLHICVYMESIMAASALLSELSMVNQLSQSPDVHEIQKTLGIHQHKIHKDTGILIDFSCSKSKPSGGQRLNEGPLIQ